MANIKFSAFTQKVVTGNVDFLVGYTGGDNVRISPAIFSDTYLPLAGGTMVGNIVFNDGVKALFGTGSDMEVFHNGSQAYIENYIGEMNFTQHVNNGYMYFKSDDGAGGTTTYMTIDGSAENIYISTDVGIGTATPGEKLHVSTDSNTVAKFESTDGNANIRVSDIADNAHLGTVNGATFIGPDTSTGGNNITILANGDVGIGTAAPGYNLEVDGTATVATDPSYIVATAGSFVMAMGAENAPGVRQEAFVGSLGATDFKLKANNTDIGRFTQTKRFVIGRDANPSSTIEAFTGGNSVDAAMLLQHDSFGADRVVGVAFELGSLQPKGAVAFRSDDDTTGQNWGIGNLIFCVDSVDDNNPVTKGDEKMRITHAGNVGIAVDNPEARLQVNEIPQAGGSTTTAPSLAHFVGSTAPSTVNGFATLKLEYPAGNVSGDPGAQIMFTQGYHSADPDNTQPVGSLRGYRTGADTQYGGGLQLTYQPNALPLGLLPGITLDGDGNTQFHENIYLGDNKKANFGNGSDLQIYHDGANSYIEDLGTGNMYIQFYERMRFQDNTGAGGTIAAFNTDSSGCQLYYQNALKIQTTNTGTVVTGQMDITALNTAPANAGDTGTLGEIRYTADYIYVCIATDTWKRTAISTW